MKQHELVIKMILDSWHTQIDAATKLFDSLTDEQLAAEIAAGKNRGVYLLGHLIAAHDRMLPLLGFGDVAYPELFDMFLKAPDKTVENITPTATLRKYWQATNERLDQHFRTMSSDAWLEKHTSVSEEDFAKEPHRNKLNIVLTRTTHLANHLGQLLLLK